MRLSCALAIIPGPVGRGAQRVLVEAIHPMNHSTKTFLACAALAGLYAGAITVKAAPANTDAGVKIQKVADAKEKSGCSGKDGCKAKESCKGTHDCKGKNDCKGHGGCKSGDNGCKGKNSCKGKGGCSTAKKPEAEKEKKA